MLIDITGFGWSGSGAYLDLLSEYNDVQFPSGKNDDWEFTLIHCVDGILDLDYKLNQKKCRIFDSEMAIRRFRYITRALESVPEFKYKEKFKGHFVELCDEYIKELVNISFYSRTYTDLLYPVHGDKMASILNRVIDLLTLNRFSRQLFGNRLYDQFHIVNEHEIEVSYNPNNFLEATRSLFRKLLEIIRIEDSKPLVMNHFFSPDNPTMGMNYLEEQAKCLVIRRDPRDTYLLAKKKLRGVPIPVDNVQDFINFYRQTIEIPCSQGYDNVLILSFEDIIYDYNSTKKKMEEFLCISEHKRPLSCFDPMVSINNTQIFRDVSGFMEDIRIIEKELTNSLYPFSNYDLKPIHDRDSLYW